METLPSLPPSLFHRRGRGRLASPLEGTTMGMVWRRQGVPLGEEKEWEEEDSSELGWRRYIEKEWKRGGRGGKDVGGSRNRSEREKKRRKLWLPVRFLPSPPLFAIADARP